MKRSREEKEDGNVNKKVKVTTADPAFWICCDTTSSLVELRSEEGDQKGADGGKPTLVLDMDETLVHAERKELKIKVGGKSVGKNKRKLWCVYKRPYVDEFLKEMGKLYEIIIFTAAGQSYADAVLDKLDTQGVIKHRLYRQHCTKTNTQDQDQHQHQHRHKVKDLARIGRDLAKVVIVDNHRHSFALNVDNGLKIKSFNGEAEDQELRKMVPVLTDVAHATDVRPVIHDRLTTLTKVH